MEVYDELFVRFRVSRGSQAQLCFPIMEAFFGEDTVQTGVPVIYTPTGEERWIRPAHFAKDGEIHTMKFEIAEAKNFTEKLGRFRNTDQGFLFDLFDVDSDEGKYIYEYLSDGLDNDITKKTITNEARATWWRTTRLTTPQLFDFTPINLTKVADRAAYVVCEQRRRRDQGLFRQIQMKNWGGCPITGATNSDLITASHFKDYAKCIGLEHIDPFNGMMLSYLFDRPFDKRYITFNFDGSIVYSPEFDGVERQAVMAVPYRPIQFQEGHYPFLKWHQEKFELKLFKYLS